MPTVEIPDETYSKIEHISKDLSDFDSTNDLIRYILAETARELDGQVADYDDDDSLDEESVEERLKSLGYME